MQKCNVSHWLLKGEVDTNFEDEYICLPDMKSLSTLPGYFGVSSFLVDH
jgi:hypothetical protein